MTGARRARVVLVALAVSLTAVPGVAFAQDAPSLAVERTAAAAGDSVEVTGRGWPPGVLVVVVLCGNAGRIGSTWCDVPNTTVVSTGENGTLTASLVVGRPPAPCPCVVRATAQTTRGEMVAARIDVEGVETLPLTTGLTFAPSRRVRLLEARLEGSGPLAAWFGGHPRRRLVLTVRNTGDVAVTDPPLVLSAGRGEEPQRIVKAPTLGRIEPGGQRTVEVPVSFEAFAFGRYTVRADIDGFDEPVTRTARTSSYPWGLFVLVLVAAEAGLVVLRNRARRHLVPGEEEEPPVVGAEVVAPPAEPAAPAASSRTPVEGLGLVHVIDLTEVTATAEAAAPVEEPARELVGATAGLAAVAQAGVEGDGGRRDQRPSRASPPPAAPPPEGDARQGPAPGEGDPATEDARERAERERAERERAERARAERLADEVARLVEARTRQMLGEVEVATRRLVADVTAAQGALVDEVRALLAGEDAARAAGEDDVVDLTADDIAPRSAIPPDP